LVADRVDRLRNLLAEYPDLLPANIEVDEFDSANRSQGNSKPPVISNQLIPGWQVGYIASFEESKVDFAAMGCWHQYFTTDFGWNSYDQCLKGLDGLLIDDNGAPDPNAMDRSVQAQAIYWVYRFYGSMTGTRVRISSPATDLTAFATRDDGRDTMNVLVGRHRRCSVETRRDPSCPAGGPATDVSVQVSWPYTGSSVHYDLQRIPDIGNGLGGPSGLLPSPSGGRVPVQAGVVTVPIPGVNDGDAYTLVLTPG